MYKIILNFYKKKRIQILFFGFGVLLSLSATAHNLQNFISTEKETGSFAIFENDKATLIVIDPADFPGIASVANWLINDIKMVSGVSPEIKLSELPATKEIILVGTLGKSRWIDQLVSDGKIEVEYISGQWERSLMQVVDNPFPGVEKALVLAGSDKRRTIYAMLNLSREMGVWPWYWWADVPVVKKNAVYVRTSYLGAPQSKQIKF